MFFKTLLVGALDTNCYLIGCEENKEALVIDPGGEESAELILDYLKENNFNLKYIVNTHGHVDHIIGNSALKTSTKALLLIHKLDANMLIDATKNFSIFMDKEIYSPSADKLLEGDEEIILGSLRFKILHTPGHTSGSICLILNGIVFTGDTLFAGGVGRTDLPGASFRDLKESIKGKLLNLSDDKIIYPGHGPSSTIGEERKKSLYLIDC